MEKFASFEVQLTRDVNGVRYVDLYGLNDVRELSWIDTREFGPFDTEIEIVRWVWRRLSLTVPPVLV